MNETECAARIRAYWKERGYDVNVRVETVKHLNHVGSYVRSDMVNGLPRSYRDHTTNTLGAEAA